MAHINRKILGSIKGTIGDVVFRERNGKVIVFSRPKKYKKTKSQKLKNERKKFATVVKLANIIKNSTDLYSIWKASKLPGSNSYQKIIKNNLKLTDDVNLSVNNILVPPGINLELNILEINRRQNKISEIKLEISLNNKEKQLFKNSTLYSLFYKTNNSKSRINMNNFYLTETRIKNDLESENFVVNIPLRIEIEKDSHLIGLFCLVSENSKQKIYWTSTKGIKVI